MKLPILNELVRWNGLVHTLEAHLERQTTITLKRLLLLERLSWRPMTMSSLSISLQSPYSAITRLVDALEKEGLVIRKRTAKDARLRYVCLTEVGREQLARYESFLGAVEAETARGIPPEGWEAAKRTQRTLEANLERVRTMRWVVGRAGGGAGEKLPAGG